MIEQRIAVCLIFLTLLAASVARATAPLGRYTVSTDTILDNRTGLTWRRAASTATRTQAQASSDCTALGSGWRLPTIGELQSIVDITKANPSIDAAFSGTPAVFFWASSPVVGAPGSVWGVDFADGSTTHWDSGNSNRFRCVR